MTINRTFIEELSVDNSAVEALTPAEYRSLIDAGWAIYNDLVNEAIASKGDHGCFDPETQADISKLGLAITEIQNIRADIERQEYYESWELETTPIGCSCRPDSDVPCYYCRRQFDSDDDLEF